MTVAVHLDGLHQPRDLGAVHMHLDRVLGDGETAPGGFTVLRVTPRAGPFGVHTVEVTLRVGAGRPADVGAEAVAVVSQAVASAGLALAGPPEVRGPVETLGDAAGSGADR